MIPQQGLDDLPTTTLMYMVVVKWSNAQISFTANFASLGFSMRILLFGWMELDHPLRMISPNLTILLIHWLFFLSAHAPNVHAGFFDKKYFYNYKYIKMCKIGAIPFW
jgi:hypothetical protein